MPQRNIEFLNTTLAGDAMAGIDTIGLEAKKSKNTEK
jgi:hypothetical protein